MVRTTALRFVPWLLAVSARAGRRAGTGEHVNIEGFVKDAQTGDPLPGANVVLAGTSLGASADIDGKYAIRSVPAGLIYASRHVRGIHKRFDAVEGG